MAERSEKGGILKLPQNVSSEKHALVRSRRSALWRSRPGARRLDGLLGRKIGDLRRYRFCQARLGAEFGLAVQPSEPRALYRTRGRGPEFGPNIYDEKLWPLIGKNIKRPRLDSTKLRSFFWEFARSRLVAVSVMNLADEFRAQRADNVRTLINATVLHVDTNAEGDRVTGLEISTIDGAKSHVSAKVLSSRRAALKMRASC